MVSKQVVVQVLKSLVEVYNAFIHTQKLLIPHLYGRICAKAVFGSSTMSPTCPLDSNTSYKTWFKLLKHCFDSVETMFQILIFHAAF